MSLFDHDLGYQAQQPIIKDLSLQVPAGSLVRSFGPTGAGENHHREPLDAVLDPDQGAIRLDGKNIRQRHAAAYGQRDGAARYLVVHGNGFRQFGLRQGECDVGRSPLLHKPPISMTLLRACQKAMIL